MIKIWIVSWSNLLNVTFIECWFHCLTPHFYTLHDYDVILNAIYGFYISVCHYMLTYRGSRVLTYFFITSNWEICFNSMGIKSLKTKNNENVQFHKKLVKYNNFCLCGSFNISHYWLIMEGTFLPGHLKLLSGHIKKFTCSGGIYDFPKYEMNLLNSLGVVWVHSHTQYTFS